MAQVIKKAHGWMDKFEMRMEVWGKKLF